MPPPLILAALLVVAAVASIRRPQQASRDNPSGPYPLTPEQYTSERSLLIEARQRAYQRTDQMITGGAAGALLLSITFLEKLVPTPPVVRPDLLLGAWLTLLVGLSASLLGQFATAKSFDCEMEGLNAYARGLPEPSNRWAFWTQLTMWLSAILLLLGIGRLALFAYANGPF